MPRYRAVIDTNVFLGSLWSTQGAAYEIFQQLRAGRWQLVLSNHLLFEYEEVGKRYAVEMELTLTDIDDVLDALCTAAEQHLLKPDWTPRLPDPDDEPLLQLAVESGADCIVTRNIRHLQLAENLGIVVLTPAEFLAKLRQQT
jgi:putative PIN family toxin of toxin-antitoxin system